MIEIEKSPGDYILYKDTHGQLLLVVFDASGIFETEHKLNSGETYSYESHGSQILPLIARRVRDQKEIEKQ